jgi:hypothetical protein
MNRFSRALLWAFVAGGARIASACPLCADNLSSDVYGKDPTQLGRGFFWSIIFMMAFPFLTAAMVTARILIARKRRARAASAPAAEPAAGMPVPEASA